MQASDSACGPRLLVLATIFGAIGVLPSTLGVDARAQSPAVKFDVRAAKGLVVSPVYEGWYEVDGTTYALFGYSNRNLEEIVDIPIGPHNRWRPVHRIRGSRRASFRACTTGSSLSPCRRISRRPR